MFMKTNICYQPDTSNGITVSPNICYKLETSSHNAAPINDFYEIPVVEDVIQTNPANISPLTTTSPILSTTHHKAKKTLEYATVGTSNTFCEAKTPQAIVFPKNSTVCHGPLQEADGEAVANIVYDEVVFQQNDERDRRHLARDSLAASGRYEPIEVTAGSTKESLVATISYKPMQNAEIATQDT